MRHGRSTSALTFPSFPSFTLAAFATLATLGACASSAKPAASATTPAAPAAAAPSPTVPAAQGYAFDVKVVGSGPPMILIPGLSCDGSVWDATVAHYQATHQLHVLTLAGFGGARGPIAEPFLATVRADLARYIREQKLDHPIIVGHSLGGFLAFWLAASEPDLTGPIVAVDGVPYLAALFNPKATPEAMGAPAKAMHDQIAPLAPEAWAAESQKSLTAMITDPAEVARIQVGAAKSSPVAVANAVAEMLTTDLRPEVAKITVPVLLLQAGSNDPTPYEAQVASIPKHRVLSFPKARHFIMLDAPADFFAALDAFLK
jgi:pimeloyl-ACP methyl ester carboxylesterase